MAWKYERKERQFSLVPEGEHRIRIKDAAKAVSKSGRDMLSLQFEVSGRNEILFHYIVFLDDKPEITNRQLTQFFDAFPGIPEGDFNLQNWIGKVGACRVRHEESDYNGGTTQARIHYFLSADKQDALPPWSEPSNSIHGGDKPLQKDEAGFMQIPEGLDGIPLF